MRPFPYSSKKETTINTPPIDSEPFPLSPAKRNPQNQNFILIAIGNKSHQIKLFESVRDDLDVIFKKNNQNFLKKHFQISNQTLNSIESKTPLVDLLVEKASILV